MSCVGRERAAVDEHHPGRLSLAVAKILLRHPASVELPVPIQIRDVVPLINLVGARELPDEPTPNERWKAWRLSRAARKAERKGRPVPVVSGAAS